MVPALLAAAFGGISPNLLDLAVLLTRGGELPGWTYGIGLLIFALLGGGVAAIWEEKDLKKAFYLGIGLPALIQVSAGSISQQRVANPEASLLTIFPIAYAQGPSAIKGRKVTIIPDTGLSQYKVIFSSEDGKRIQEREINDPGEKAIGVPPFASSIAVQKGLSLSAAEKLPPEPNIHTTFEVKVKKKVWSGFFRSLGLRNDPTYDVKVQRKAR